MRVKELVADIQVDVNEGVLSFSEIASKYEVPLYFVDEAAMAIDHEECEDDAA